MNHTGWYIAPATTNFGGVWVNIKTSDGMIFQAVLVRPGPFMKWRINRVKKNFLKIIELCEELSE